MVEGLDELKRKYKKEQQIHLDAARDALRYIFFPPKPGEIIPVPSPWDEPDYICCRPAADLIIAKKMKENNIVVRKEDPSFLKQFHVKVIGDFECNNCTVDWRCYNATIVVDLYERDIPKKYKQYCRGCQEDWAHLYFTNKQFDRIADRVITYYKKRKQAGGTVPAIENNGSYSSKAFTAHEEKDCKRCHELDEPCWLYLVPYIKKVPYELVQSVRSSLSDIDEPLKRLYASAVMEVKDASKICRININPLSGSEGINHWREKCETILESFLQKFNTVSLLIQPDFSKQITVQPKPSISAELQSVLYITGDRKKVAEAFKRIENTAKEIKRQHEAGKCKPCIILW